MIYLEKRWCLSPWTRQQVTSHPYGRLFQAPSHSQANYVGEGVFEVIIYGAIATLGAGSSLILSPILRWRL
ncbi:hypothetical protein ASC96_25345 [Rhizobium sp. Root1204]|nr:hypothetical protein ASC96_25345 [Rhizobium sp. Root1204]